MSRRRRRAARPDAEVRALAELVDGAALELSGWPARLGELVRADRTGSLATAVLDGGDRGAEVSTPPLRRVSLIQRHLETLQLHRVASAHALERMPAAVFFVAENGAVLFHNAEARRLVATDDGLSITDEGRLELASWHGGRRVVCLPADAGPGDVGTLPAGGRTLRVPRAAGRPYLAVLSPLLVSAASSRRVAVVLVMDPERPFGATAVLEDLYDLTPAEARLAALLAGGHTLEEATEILGITRNTARWTLKQVFAKTDTGRQVALVRLLLTGPAALGSWGGADRRDPRSK